MNPLLALIDLSSRRVVVRPVPPQVQRLLLGGRGINMFLLHHFACADPLADQAPLIVGAGCLTGSEAPSACRVNITARSPETGLLADANIGGFFGAFLVRAGIYHLVITGKSAEPAVILVGNRSVSIHGAHTLWGLDTQESQRLLRQQHAGAQCLVIGPAGENLVRFACIMHGVKDAAARGGLGCLMGAKRLKAIVVKHLPSPAGSPRLAEAARALHQRLEKSPAVNALRKRGTAYLLPLHNHQHILRSMGATATRFPEAMYPARAPMRRYYLAHTRGCYGCRIRCRHVYRIDGATGEGPEYGVLSAFGALCGISDPDMLLRLNNLVNALGLDAITTGNILAWTFECGQAGLLTGPMADLRFRWGQGREAARLVAMIAGRRGVGNLLADGYRGLQRLSLPEARLRLPVVKNLIQSDGVDVRAHKGFALGVATATRGADHLRNRPTLEALSLSAARLREIYGRDVAPEPGAYAGKAAMVVGAEREYALGDALGLCRFVQRFNAADHINVHDMGCLLHAAGLGRYTYKELVAAAERIISLERYFLHLSGMTAKSDCLPAACYKPLPSGPFKGQCIEPDRLRHMVREYYGLHGWSAAGVPDIPSLRELLAGWDVY